MNNWNQLRALSDEAFGFQSKIRSKFRKVSQAFDEKTYEHVILIEYRVTLRRMLIGHPMGIGG